MSVDFIFKISVIGDPAVGKTSLIKQYTDASFQKQYIQTIGAQFSTYNEEIDDLQCRLSFWDIAGQEQYSLLRPTFYKGTQAAIIVYSLEDSERESSLNNVEEWFNDIKKFRGNIPMVLFGNKIDLVDEGQLDDAMALELVKKYGFIGYYKTSAKTGEGVTEAFHAIVKKLIKDYQEKHS